MVTFKRIILISMIGLCAACSVHEQPEIPEFNVSNLQFEGVTIFETSATVEVRIDNPNPYPLTLHGGVHRLYVNDVYLGRGFDRSNVTIDKLSSVSRPVSVRINNMSLISQMQDIVLKPELSYRIESVLYQPITSLICLNNFKEVGHVINRYISMSSHSC